MGFTYIAESGQEQSSSSTTVATPSTLNVAAGDLIVCYVGSWGSAANNHTLNSVSDGGSNTCTLGTTNIRSSGYWEHGTFAYVLVAAANATATFTATFSDAVSYRCIHAWQFRPDTNEEAEFDAEDATQEYTTNQTSFTSGTINTSADAVVLGGASNGNVANYSNHQIGGVADDGVDDDNMHCSWYRIIASSQSNLSSSVTVGTSPGIINVASFKSVATSEAHSGSGSATVAAATGSGAGGLTPFHGGSGSATAEAATGNGAGTQIGVHESSGGLIAAAAIGAGLAEHFDLIQGVGSGLGSAAIGAGVASKQAQTQGAVIVLYDGATLQANLTGITGLWWDASSPTGAPDIENAALSTDALGEFSWDISASTGLTVGQTGFLFLYKADGGDYKDSLVFASEITVSNIT